MQGRPWRRPCRLLIALVFIPTAAAAQEVPAGVRASPVFEVGTTAFEAPAQAKPDGGRSEAIYLIRLAEPPLARYEGGIAGLAPTSLAVTGARELDASAPASVAYLEHLAGRQAEFVTVVERLLSRKIEVVYRYRTANNGVAARVTPREATVIEALPGVVFVQRDFTRRLLTDAGPAWIGADGIWDGSATGGLPGTQGEGIIVGVIDTGINPSNPSFAEVDPVDGYVHQNPYGSGSHTPGSYCDLVDPNFCNDKLIGAWSFVFPSPDPTDLDGHGSHTASTAAGNHVDATVSAPTTSDTRRLSGVAPHANIIAYRACDIGCAGSALAAAIDQAILDEVDVVNYSIGGGPSNPWTDFDSVGFLNMNEAGIFAATSAGNSGPFPGSVGSPADAPWLTAVGAGSHDRGYPNSLIDMFGGVTPPPPNIIGEGFTSGYGPAPIVYAGDFGDPMCLSPFPPGTFTAGEIVLCDRGIISRVQKSQNVADGGAGGLILAGRPQDGKTLAADAFVIPGLNITYEDGAGLKAWLATGTGQMGTISGASLDFDPARGDHMAAFSSRGPNPSVDNVIKPDVTAPGVNILAARGVGNPNPPEWGFLSGTSMSSPHVAGAAALLRDLHPDWTPDEIRSSIMTTAYQDVRKEDGVTPADPFDMGSGRIDLVGAAQAGLVLDETAANYEAANPALGGLPRALNLASMADPSCFGTCDWTRTVTSTRSQPTVWRATVQPGDPAMGITVTPSELNLAGGGSASISVEVDTSRMSPDEWAFGSVTLTEHYGMAPDAVLPIAVLPADTTAPTRLAKSVNLPVAAPGDTLDYQIDIVNFEPGGSASLTDPIPGNAAYVSSSASAVIDGMTDPGFTYDAVSNSLGWTGTIGQANLELLVGSSPFGYLPLASLGVPPFALPSNADDGGWILTPLDFFYRGQHYTTVIWSVNGTVEAGSASGFSSGPTNSDLPNSLDAIDNMIAPFWTDLNLSATGNWYAAFVSFGATIWTVFEWEDVPLFSNPSSKHTFQVWIEHGTPNISFVYETLDPGVPANLTVGLENEDGTMGFSYYFNGVGTPPSTGNDLLVEPTAVGTGQFSFQAKVQNQLNPVVNIAEATIGGETLQALAATAVDIAGVCIPTVVITDMIFNTDDGPQMIEACLDMEIGPGVQFLHPSNTWLRAGSRHKIVSGTKIGPDAKVTLETDPSLLPP